MSDRKNLLFLGDDNLHSEKVIEALTKSSGLEFEVFLEKDYCSGLDKAASNKFNLIIVDCKFNSHGGIKFIEEAILNGCDIPIIIFIDEENKKDSIRIEKSAFDAGAANSLTPQNIKDEFTHDIINFSIETNTFLSKSEQSYLVNRLKDKSPKNDDFNKNLADVFSVKLV